MTEITLQIAAGFLLLILGGESLVRGSVALARNLGVSKLVIGLVLVGFGTSTPELATSLNAALIGSAGIAVGNVVGSNISNTFLILGVTAAIYPIACDPNAFKRDAPMLSIATMVCVAFALSGEFGRLTGAVFLAVLLGYTGFTYLTERRQRDASAVLHEQEAGLAEPAPRSTWIAVLLAGGGIALIVVGADIMVAGSIELARLFEIPETIIGLTLVALGTSLPELATSVVAALRRQTDLAFGNIIGSNLFNILGILGVTAVVAPIPVPPNVLVYDLWILLMSMVLLTVFGMTHWNISRREGIVFIACYVGYLGFTALRGAGMM